VEAVWYPGGGDGGLEGSEWKGDGRHVSGNMAVTH